MDPDGRRRAWKGSSVGRDGYEKIAVGIGQDRMLDLNECGEGWRFDQTRACETSACAGDLAVEDVYGLRRAPFVQINWTARLRDRWCRLILSPEFPEQVLARSLADGSHLPCHELHKVLVRANRIDAFMHLMKRLDQSRQVLKRQGLSAFESDLDLPRLIFVAAHKGIFEPPTLGGNACVRERGVARHLSLVECLVHSFDRKITFVRLADSALLPPQI